MEIEEQLLANITRYIESSKKVESDINSSFTLLFKAMSVLMDLFILKKENLIPSNHAERFRILEKKYPLLYRILDKNFPLYQNSYRAELSKEYKEVLENDFREVIKFTKINVEY